VTRRSPSTDRPAGARAPSGFTFLELLVVMGVLAVMMGLGIGYLTNVGRSAQGMQAASLLTAAGNRCQNNSAGGKRATMHLRERRSPEGDPYVELFTAVERPILTANFEASPKDRPEMDWFTNAAGTPGNARVVGNAKIDEDGKSGSAATLARGSYVDFGTRSGFAVTDGVSIDLWVRVAPGGGTMTLVRSDDDRQRFFELRLEKENISGPDSYKVVLLLWLVSADHVGTAGAGVSDRFESAAAVVSPNLWTRIEASFDGRDVSLRVAGVERRPAKKKPLPGTPVPPETPARRFASTSSGVAHLTLSAADTSFVGSVDTLVVSGIFRGQDDETRLGGDARILRPSLPLRVVYANGILDPAVHSGDVVVYMVTPEDEGEGTAWAIRYGLYGDLPPPKKEFLGGPGSAPAGAAPAAPPAGRAAQGTGEGR
jgi:prepilin-type N-terminal cleavage/methylation domain-containing protein